MSRQSTPVLYATHTTELMRIAFSGWDIAAHPTPVGVFYRLEKGAFYRGGPLRGWWWRPTLAQAVAHLLREALEHPRITKARSVA